MRHSNPRSVRRPVRYAVVGLGNIAQLAVLPAFARATDNSKLVALISSDPVKLGALAEKYAVDHTGPYERFESVLEASEADAVYIALPNTMHRSMTERASLVGVHVLCEKPMATRVEDCEAMIAATRAAGVKLMVAYRLPFEQANRIAMARLQRGELGELRVFSSVFSQLVREGDVRARAQMGGGAMFDMGIYCVHAARHVFGQEPVEVVAFRDPDLRIQGVDEVASALLVFPGGRVAQITATQSAANVAECRVVGTKGDLRLDPAFECVSPLRELMAADDSGDPPKNGRRDPFATELLHFSSCILGGAELSPSAEEALCDVRVLEAIEKAARTGQRVELPLFVRRDRPAPRMDPTHPLRARPTPSTRFRPEDDPR